MRQRTTDRFGRLITYYISRPTTDRSLPLVVCVQGSGGQSIFVQVDTPDGPRLASGGSEAVLLGLRRDEMRVLVVEKLGVAFLEQPEIPGSAEQSSSEFRREHTLDRWTEALRAAIEHALSMPGIDGGRVMAVGHSEGAQVVANLAAMEPRITHIALLAPGGPTQLFDLIEQARSGAMGLPQEDPNERVAWLIEGWKRVMADPEADDRLWLGHPHRRWYSFAFPSLIDAVRGSSAAVFIAQGTADTATLPLATDALYAELLAAGREPHYLRVEAADHSFATEADPTGWIEVHRALWGWFEATSGATPLDAEMVPAGSSDAPSAQEQSSKP